jgi:putative ATP-binding cassette transporter
MKNFLKVVFSSIGYFILLKCALLSCLSGLLSFLFINQLNKVVELLIGNAYTEISLYYVVVFTTIILAFIWVRRTISKEVIHLSQTIIWSLRKEILGIILKANYKQLESNKSRIRTALVNDIGELNRGSLMIIEFATAIFLSIACLVYMALISIMLFGITIAVALAGCTFYYQTSKKNLTDFEESHDLENNFLQYVDDILMGFKGIFMEPGIGFSIYNKNINPISERAYKVTGDAYTRFLNNQIIGQVIFYALISMILLVLSIKLHLETTYIVSFVFTLIYFLGSIQVIMTFLPHLARAKVASNRLLELQNELKESNFKNNVATRRISKDEFENIVIKGLKFQFSGEGYKSFAIGPVDFQISRGQVAFIYGGNGSGKTTFINALMGLYMPDEGEIKMNNTPIDEQNYSNYRSSFSVVFSDFYLFRDVLWLNDFNVRKWDYFINLFELKEKVTLKDGILSTTELSTGQRKRLALVIALLEEKPLLVLDEWAADQDPYFREKFYKLIIPELQKQNVTIIAITHDDKYYHCADKLYKMDYGLMVEDNIATSATYL